MKISEIIYLLEKESEKNGDREVLLLGCYGATSKVFEILEEKYVRKENSDYLNIWTDMMTG